MNFQNPTSNPQTMIVRDAAEADLPAIVAIYNAAIPCRRVTADLEPVTVESRLAWFRAHQPHDRPLWVLEVDDRLAGWLGFQSFYGRPAYAATAELSLYVSPEFQRQGIGRTLLAQAIEVSPSLGLTTLLGFIFADNHPSVRLFEHFGFEQWGCLPQVAKFGAIERDLLILGRRV